MKYLIIENQNGVNHGEVYESTINSLDKENSKALLSSLFVHVDEKGRDIAHPKNSDDKIILGYTLQGSNFLIIIDGFYGSDREVNFNFVDNHVLPLMEKYCLDLGKTNDPDSVTRALIKTIYVLEAQHAKLAQFTMSIAMNYHHEGTLRCAGFGIGDTAILIKQKQAYKQLVFHTEVDEFKDAFDGYSQANIDRVIQRNSVFNLEIEPGDELVAYTYVQPSLERLSAEFPTDNLNPKWPAQAIKQLGFDFSLLPQQDNLFSELKLLVEDTQIKVVNEAVKSRKSQRLGDDFSLAGIIVPELILENKIKFFLLHSQITSVLEQAIEERGNNQSLLSVFTGSKELLRKAQIFRQMILECSDYREKLVLFLMIIESADLDLKAKLLDSCSFSSDLAWSTCFNQLLHDDLLTIEGVVVQEDLDKFHTLKKQFSSYANNKKNTKINAEFYCLMEEYKQKVELN